ncbi:MAG: DNA repair protein RecO [Coriobacteriales bacterium]
MPSRPPSSLTYRTSGIVLRRTKLGETDLIVTLLTELPVQVRVVAKGARKPGARLAGVMGLGNEVDLLVRRGRSLDIVSEGQLLTSRAQASEEFEREAMMEAVLDVAAEVTVEGEHDARLLPLTSTALGAVMRAPTVLLPLVGAAYTLKAVSIQGYRPVLDACVSCGRPVRLAGERTPDGAPRPEGAVPCTGEELAGELLPPGLVSVSFSDGGALCDDCSRDLRGTRYRREALSWASSLIRMRFTEVLALSPAPAMASLGHDTLSFARDWLAHYPGVHPRALRFVLSLDYGQAHEAQSGRP